MDSICHRLRRSATSFQPCLMFLWNRSSGATFKCTPPGPFRATSPSPFWRFLSPSGNSRLHSLKNLYCLHRLYKYKHGRNGSWNYSTLLQNCSSPLHCLRPSSYAYRERERGREISEKNVNLVAHSSEAWERGTGRGNKNTVPSCLFLLRILQTSTR